MRALALALTLAALTVTEAAPAADTYTVLSYHDVRDDLPGDLYPDRFAVDTEHLVEQFEWLRGNGYQPIGLDDLAAAQRGERPLPEKAVLLTFDDGLRSVYTKVFPLLKLYGYPAVVDVVTSWLEARELALDYGGITRQREDFLTWEQVKEMADSGLVEIATHSHNMQRGILGNPFGNEQPAAVTRLYNPDDASYETDTEYRRRIREDLARSAELIETHTGKRPRAIVWPFGAYNRVTESIARELGMDWSFGLGDGRNRLAGRSGLQRILVTGNPALADWVWRLRNPDEDDPWRIVHVDLDYVYDPDPAQQHRNLSRLIDRIAALDVRGVYLQAFADPDGDGNASAVYFPNRHMPVRADLFNRVAWQLQTRAGVEVFAWMPVLAFELPNAEQRNALALQERADDGTIRPAGGDYRRLSPFKHRAREIIGEIYGDLARHAAFAGILFHDDAYLRANEGLLDPVSRSIGELSPRQRSRRLAEFTDMLAERVRRWRPEILTARNLYARPVIQPEAERWFAQSLPVFVDHYDQVAVMAMPWLERADEPDDWLIRLLEAVRETPGALERTVFELQARRWRKGERVPASRLARQLHTLQQYGARHMAYYPDDFIAGHPQLGVIRPAISNARYPYDPP